MRRGRLYVSITNPHGGDISVGILKRILKTAGISEKEWESAK
jgi:DNA-binding transcriptional regulator PaaX